MPGNFLQVVPTASQQTMTVTSRESRYHSSNLVHEIPYVPYLLSHVNQMRGQLNYVMQAMQNCVATCPLESGQTAEAVHNSFGAKFVLSPILQISPFIIHLTDHHDFHD